MSLFSLSHSFFHSLFFSRYIYNVHYTIVTKKQYVFLLLRFSFFLSFNTFVSDLASFYRHCFTRFLHLFIIFFSFLHIVDAIYFFSFEILHQVKYILHYRINAPCLFKETLKRLFCITRSKIEYFFNNSIFS